MQSIVYVGMDVHVDNFTFACYEEDKGIYAQNQVRDANWKSVIKYLENIQKTVKRKRSILFADMRQAVWDTLYIMICCRQKQKYH